MSTRDPRIAKFFDGSTVFPIGASSPAGLLRSAKIALGAAAVSMTFISTAGAQPTLMQVQGEPAQVQQTLKANAEAFERYKMDEDFVEIASDVVGLWAPEDVALTKVKNLQHDSSAAGQAREFETEHFRINFNAATGDGYVAIKKGMYNLPQDTLVITTQGNESSQVANREVLDAVRHDMRIANGMDGQSADLANLKVKPAPVSRSDAADELMDLDFIEISTDLIGLWKKDTVALAMIKNLGLDSQAAGKPLTIENDMYEITFDGTKGLGHVTVKKGQYNLREDALVIVLEDDGVSVVNREVLDAIRHDMAIVNGMDGATKDLSNFVPSKRASVQTGDNLNDIVKIAEAADFPLNDVKQGDRENFVDMVKGAIKITTGGQADADTGYKAMERAINACIQAGMAPCKVTTRSIDVSYAKGALTLSTMDMGVASPIVTLSAKDGLELQDETRFANLLGEMDETVVAKMLEREAAAEKSPETTGSIDRDQPDASPARDMNQPWALPEPGENRLLHRAGFSLIEGLATANALGISPGSILQGAKRGIDSLSGKPAATKKPTSAPAKKSRPRVQRTSFDTSVEPEVIEAAEVEFEDETPSFRM